MYSAKLTGLKPKDVMHLINSLPAHVECKFAQTKVEAPPQANGKDERVGPEDHIKLGPNTDRNLREGSLSWRIDQMVRKHEVSKGAGSMTRALLTKKLENFSDAPGAAISAALSRGIIAKV